MKALAILYFDDMITVPLGKVIGDNATADVCDSMFRAAEGWELFETAPGVFTLRAEHMPAPLTVGGHGYRYIAVPIEAVDTEAPLTTKIDPDMFRQLSAVVPSKGKRK